MFDSLDGSQKVSSEGIDLGLEFVLKFARARKSRSGGLAQLEGLIRRRGHVVESRLPKIDIVSSCRPARVVAKAQATCGRGGD